MNENRPRFHIRSACEGDLVHLPAIERAAAEQLTSYPAALAQSAECFETTNPIETFRAGMVTNDLWVAEDQDRRPVGFALMMEIDGNAHLEEIDVLPSHQRRGIGRALVNTVCGRAREGHYPAVTLSTFSPVPWNQPFYEDLGFEVVPGSELSAGYRRIREIEQANGLNLELRVIMQRRLHP